MRADDKKLGKSTGGFARFAAGIYSQSGFQCISSDRFAVCVLLYLNMFSQIKILGVPDPLHSDNLQGAKSASRVACEASVVKAGQLPPRINCLSEASFVSGGTKAGLLEQETQCVPKADLPLYLIFIQYLWNSIEFLRFVFEK